jgi:hypothetical protein
MRLQQLARRHPLPAIFVLIVLATVSTLGVRALSSQTSDEQTAAAVEQPIAEPAAFQQDGRYTTWQPAEYVPEAQPTTQVVPAIAPLPKPNAWSELSTLDVAMGVTEQQESRELELPAPAGLDESMNPFDAEHILAGRSVESSYQGDARVPVIRVGRGRGGMSGGVCR